MTPHRSPVTSFLLACLIGAACASNAPRQKGTGGDAGEGGAGGTDTSDTAGTSGGGSGGKAGSSGNSGSGGSGGDLGGSGGAAGDQGGMSGAGGTGGDAAGAGGGDDGGVSSDAPMSGGDGGAGGTGGLSGMHVVYVLHDTMAGSSVNDPSRKSLLDILNSMHDSHGVVVKLADSVTPAAMMPDASLIIVGPNASEFNHHPAPDLKTTTIPVIVSKDGHTDEIGLGTVMNTAAMYDTIKIIKADHPLAAGFPVGNVQVLTTTNAQRLVRISGVGPDAIKIAISPVDATSYTIVAYEKGGMMPNNFRAPAKRMGLFWHRPAAATPDGAKLVKAAIDWMLRP